MLDGIAATVVPTRVGAHEHYFEELAELLAKPGAPDVEAIAEPGADTTPSRSRPLRPDLHPRNEYDEDPAA